MRFRLLLAMCCCLGLQQRLDGQASLPIYTDSLANGFGDYGWATLNFANTSPVQSGSDSVSVSAADWQALWMGHADFSTAPYTNFSFWINGGSGGGQIVQVAGVQIQDGNGVPLGTFTLPALAANTWRQFTIPLSTLGVANLTNCDGFWWQLTASGTTNTFYIDTVQMGAVPAPATIHIAVNAGQSIRTADSRWFGINTAIWDSDLDTPTTISQLKEAGVQFLRFPGGSDSDDYNWATDESGTNTWMWGTSFTNFAHVATNIGAQAVLTANYGTGTPAEAAAWVKYSNVTNHYGFKYWEVGNELYGTWEIDSNTFPHDPYTYATRAQAYIQQMKAADPTIKVGVVVTTGEDSDSNGYDSHPATNTATGQVHYGWTPVLMSTLKSLDVTPDFAIYHWYPQSGSDSDPFLLAGSGNWTNDGPNLRSMISNYFGPGGTNIELLVTENNSDSGPEGKQSTSLVNAIYNADSVCQLMQTEFNSFIWWDLRNGEDTTGDMNPALYGWRPYGDLGVLNGLATDLTNRYPTYFSAKLMQFFVRGGDTVLQTSSSYYLLTAYSARRTNGELTLLVINKDSASSFAGQIALSGFTPARAATIYSYGMSQDNAAEAGNNACDIAQTNFAATSNFSYTFPPYSLTLFSFGPPAPALAALPALGNSNQFVLQLSGQAGTPYILQTSTNLSTWSSVSTNLAATGSVNITNSISRGAQQQFWRAVWIP